MEGKRKINGNVPFLRLRRMQAVSSPTMASADWITLPARGAAIEKRVKRKRDTEQEKCQ